MYFCVCVCIHDLWTCLFKDSRWLQNSQDISLTPNQKHMGKAIACKKETIAAETLNDPVLKR